MDDGPYALSEDKTHISRNNITCIKEIQKW